jgi:hypothetical protein
MPVCCCGVVLAFDLFWFIEVWIEGDVWQNYSKQTDGNPTRMQVAAHAYLCHCNVRSQTSSSLEYYLQLIMGTAFSRVYLAKACPRRRRIFRANNVFGIQIFHLDTLYIFR